MIRKKSNESSAFLIISNQINLSTQFVIILPDSPEFWLGFLPRDRDINHEK